MGLRGHNINNAAAAVEDYRTGEILAYVGSASYTSKGNKKFQPQFDVLSDGWRQPGSAIKPIDYPIGIDDKTLTAATMLMDVTTNFGGSFIPTQADKLERGPVRVRSALQFSLNIPAIKATIMSGLDHVFERTKDFGLTYPKTAVPVLSRASGRSRSTRSTCSGAYGTIANGGMRMPQPVIGTILRLRRHDRLARARDDARAATASSARGAAYILTDILAGNTDKKVNPFWGKWAIYDGKTRRPAAYKTGTTSDNRDVAAYGFLAPPADKKAPALAVGVWMGNSDNTPERRQALARYVRPALVGDPDRGEQGQEDRPVQAAASGLVTATVDAFTGLKPGPFTTKTVSEYFLPGTVPTQKETIRVAVSIDAATRPAVARRMRRTEGHQGLLQPVRGRVELPELAEGQRQLGRAGGTRLGRRRRPEGHAHGVLLQRRSRRSAGPGARRSRRPSSARCTRAPPPSATRSRATPAPIRRRHRPASRVPTPPPSGRPDETSRARPASREQTLKPSLTGRRADQNSTIVAPSPPSPRCPGRIDLTSGWLAAALRTASRTAPVPMPWMTRTLSRPASPASSR